MSTTEITALVVALIALVISLLQTARQYISAAVVHSKVDKAAIGRWAYRNRYRWSLRELRWHVEYVRPECSAREVVEQIGQRSKKQRETMASVLPDYKLNWENQN